MKCDTCRHEVSRCDSCGLKADELQHLEHEKIVLHLCSTCAYKAMNNRVMLGQIAGKFMASR